MSHQYYLVSFDLPDGEHLLLVNAHPSVATLHAKRIVEMNPDAKFDPDRMKPLASPDEIDQAVTRVREQNPDRPTPEQLGLDTPARLLTDPQIARDVAAQMGLPVPTEPINKP